MKLLNTAIITTLLTAGLAANALAAPNQHGQKNDKKATQKVVVIKQAPKKVTVKKAPQRVVKKVVQQAPKRVVSKSYKVRPGDTLSKIAARNRTSVNNLIKINKLWGNKANNLKVGMVIRLS